MIEANMSDYDFNIGKGRAFIVRDYTGHHEHGQDGLKSLSCNECKNYRKKCGACSVQYRVWATIDKLRIPYESVYYGHNLEEAEEHIARWVHYEDLG